MYRLDSKNIRFLIADSYYQERYFLFSRMLINGHGLIFEN